jgi:hypothetical protein
MGDASKWGKVDGRSRRPPAASHFGNHVGLEGPWRLQGGKMDANERAKARRKVRKVLRTAAHTLEHKDTAQLAGSLAGARQFKRRMKKAYKKMSRS